MGNTRRLVDIILLLIVLVGGYFAVRNATAIGDWWHFLNYDPPEDIVEIAEDAGMNERGKRLFYRFSPTFVEQSRLDAECGDHALG